MFREAGYYSRMALGLVKWARVPLEPDPPALIRRTLQNRESNFLGLMRQAVFENPAHPYHTLFAWAGCTCGDLERLVRQDGLEKALATLYQAGVYLAHDEFKGKKPVERGGKSLVVDPPAMANPRVTGVVEVASSSASRSLGTVTKRSLEYQVYREAQNLVMTADYEEGKRPLISMTAVLPGTSGLRRVLNYTRRGRPPEKWYAMGGDLRSSAHYRLVTLLLLAELRLLGLPVTFPSFLPHNDFSPVARWLARRKQQGFPCLVTAAVSRAVRVAAAAQEAGLDISGTLFLVGSETFTDAKRRVLEAAGCEAHPRYAASELGTIGVSCRHMTGNRVHVCLDSIAVINRRRIAPLSDVEVDSLLLTTLLPSAPTVVVNVEMDDAGTLGRATCDCSLTALGLTQQIDQIFSYGKLTGGGTTLLSDDLLHILEHHLPARFGGVPSDYQLVECEGTSQTEIELRVHPRLKTGPEAEIKSSFLAEIKRLRAGSLTRSIWLQTESVRVVRAEPYTVGRGKVNALHLLGSKDHGR